MNTLAKVMVTGLTVAAIGFGANAWAKRDGGMHGDRMVNRISSVLELDDSQAAALKTLQQEILETRTLMKGDKENIKTKVKQMINAETFDQGLALSMINERAEAIQANAPELVAAAGTFMDGLNADQKAKVQEFMEKGHGKRFKHKHSRD